MNITIDDLLNALEQRTFVHSKPRMLTTQPTHPQTIIASRKYNGNCAALFIHKSQPQFYTVASYKLNMNSTFWMDGEKERWQELPPGTLLLGEIHVPAVTMEDTDQLQQWYAWHMGKTHVPPSCKTAFRAFDLLSWNSQVIMSQPYQQRWAQIPGFIRVEQAPHTSLLEAQQAAYNARQRQIEGYVFWDAHAPSYCRLKGQQTPRGGSWKIKPQYQEVGLVEKILQPQIERLLVSVRLNNKTFNCGSGLTMEERRLLVDLHQKGKTIPLIVRHYGWSNNGLPDKPVLSGIL